MIYKNPNNKYYAQYSSYPHTFYDKVVEAGSNQKGCTMHYCNCGYYEEWDTTGYASDMSTLTAALKDTDRLSKKDFSAESCAARGYVTYADADGILHTVYSNQINVVDTQIV